MVCMYCGILKILPPTDLREVSVTRFQQDAMRPYDWLLFVIASVWKSAELNGAMPDHPRDPSGMKGNSYTRAASVCSLLFRRSQTLLKAWINVEVWTYMCHCHFITIYLFIDVQEERVRRPFCLSCMDYGHLDRSSRTPADHIKLRPVLFLPYDGYEARKNVQSWQPKIMHLLVIEAS